MNSGEIVSQLRNFTLRRDDVEKSRADAFMGEREVN